MTIANLPQSKILEFFNEANYETSTKDFDSAMEEVLAEDEAIQRCESSWRDVLLSKKEREGVFIDAGAITREQAEETRLQYLREELGRQARKNEQGEKNEKAIRMIYSEYQARIENKQLNDDSIQSASQTPIKNLYETNGRKVVCCPFHKDSSPSMSITGNLWHCFSGCGGGDTIEFVKKLHGLDFKAAVKFILNV